MIGKVNKFLAQRLKKIEKEHKTSIPSPVKGNLASFSTLFGVTELNHNEKESLLSILKTYSSQTVDIDTDLTYLMSLTSEVKAINNQAVILHGERIKKAQTLLKRYKDGAFTAWLITTYGNRQTPYNFLQYYEFYMSVPQTIRPLLEAMPKQAIYTLASREGSIEKKRKIIESFKGETKTQLLMTIRAVFPLSQKDKRKQDFGQASINYLLASLNTIKNHKNVVSELQREKIQALVSEISDLISL